MLCAWALPLTLSVVLLLGGVVRPAGGEPPMIDPAVWRSLQTGDARVVVELRLPRGFQPEGRLTDTDAVAAQRDAISDAQSTVLDRLGGTDFSAIRRYQSVPFLVLQVGTQALARLETMTDVVVRVRREGTAKPLAEPEILSGRPDHSE